MESRDRKGEWFHRRSAIWVSGQRLVVLLLAGMVLIGLASCSSFVRDVSDFQTGWRTAEVVEIGSADEIKAQGVTDCRTTASAEELASSRFAVVTYRMGRTRHAHILLVDARSVVARGDTIYTNVLRCGTPLEVRTPLAVGRPPAV